MTTNTAPNLLKAIITFNVFFREDTTTQSFLPSIISKSPEHWALFRNVFSEQKDCKLTIVDKSIETPFHCLLVTLFCKQLEEELQGKRLGITVFQPRLKVCTFARTNYYEYGKQRQVQESP